MLGYVYTSYGKRATNSILLEIDSYSRWYHVDGVLFDEMSNAAGYETYYSDLGRVAKSYGCKSIFGNPGTMTLSSFIGTVDNLVVYENHGLPSPASLRSLTMGMNKDNFSYIAHGVSQLDSYSLARTLRFVSYLYVTEANPQEAYCTLPEYFDVLVARLDRTNVGKINEDGSSFHRLFEKLFQR